MERFDSNMRYDTDATSKIRELFAKAQKGDAAALDDALVLLRPRIMNIIAVRIPDVAAREDIAQDTLIKILRLLPALPKDADPYAYFMTMARNAAVDYIRKQARSVAMENIDLFADELLDESPVDSDLFDEIIGFILSIPTAPYRILVYINNRFIYPARYGTDGRHRGFPRKIIDELGNLVLSRIAELTFEGLSNEFAPVEKAVSDKFYGRLRERENGIVFADMVLIEILGERPAAMISMWTDRINKQVLAHVTEQK